MVYGLCPRVYTPYPLTVSLLDILGHVLIRGIQNIEYYKQSNTCANCGYQALLCIQEGTGTRLTQTPECRGGSGVQDWVRELCIMTHQFFTSYQRSTVLATDRLYVARQC